MFQYLKIQILNLFRASCFEIRIFKLGVWFNVTFIKEGAIYKLEVDGESEKDG